MNPRPKKVSILHLLIAIALLSFAARFGNILHTGRPQAIPTAQAVEETDAQPPPMKGAPETKTEEKHEDPQSHSDAAAQSGKEPAATEATTENEKPLEETAPRDFTDSEVELLQALAARREELNKREKELQSREALLQAAEQQVDRKIAELKTLRGEMEKLLGQQTKDEEARIASLVKIYESMKPKEAATIFNTLEMDVLLQVLGRMSERRSAPIIAGMTPEKARDLTIKLAEQKKLPALPE